MSTEEKEESEEWRIRYTDLEFGTMIGKGVFGAVYEGKWKEEPVALKTLVIRLHGRSKFEDLRSNKKWREFEVWYRLKHKNIVRLYGVAVRATSAFSGEWEITFVMEKCEGSLFELVKAFPNLSIDSRIKYAKEIAIGMKHIHANAILHRDLKCMNILIINDVVKICDFGTSRIKDEETIDMTMDYIGSPSHMAPEIWAKKAADRGSDVWSYGMCVYNIFARKPPFDGMDKFQLHQYLIQNNKRPKWPRNKAIPKWIKELVDACWAKKPERRCSFDDIVRTFNTNTPMGSGNFGESKHEFVFVDSIPLEDRFLASMVLSGVGDIIGFFNAKFEGLLDGSEIHRQVAERGGALSLNPGALNLLLSSDLVMALASAKACSSAKDDFEVTQDGLTSIMEAISEQFITAFKDMRGRYPGRMTIRAVRRLGWRIEADETAVKLRESGVKWFDNPYDPRAGGCGGTTRACPIGLRFPGAENRSKLIAVSIESGRLTHNNTTGFLGSLTAALFTAYALERISVYSWGFMLINEAQDQAKQYLLDAGRDTDEIRRDFKTFFLAWNKYLKERRLENGKGPAKFPRRYKVKNRDDFYKSYSFDGKGGASGHDSVIISYDALIGALQAADNDPSKVWEEVLLRGVLHGGDSDSTGTIVGAWYGALFGFTGVPECNYKTMEKIDELKAVGADLFKTGGALIHKENPS